MRELAGFPGLGRTRVMGIVNVTADSFSDGGLLPDTATAVRHGLRLLDQGADLLDVGGESTRPGAERVPVAQELHRVLPVVRALVAAGAVVSVDTTRAQVAREAVDAGALLVNDVSGGLADPPILAVVAQAGVAYCAMHGRGPSASMQRHAVYRDVVAEVRDELTARRDDALAAGADRLLLDPGLGFAKTAEHNWALLRRLDRLDLGHPVLVGASRKAFLGALLADPDGTARRPGERDDATAAVAALAAQAGVWGVRVHEVRACADAVRVAAAWTGPA